MSGMISARRAFGCLVALLLLSEALTLLIASGAHATPGAAGSTASSTSASSCGLDRGSAAYHGTNPNRDLKRAVPDPLKVVGFPCAFPSNIRGIKLSPDSVELVAGGRLQRRIAVPNPSVPMTLPKLVSLVDNPSWISSDKGTVDLKVALVQEAGTRLAVTAPAVTQVRLWNNPHVALAGSHSVVRFKGVVVTSWNPSTKTPVDADVNGRPFVLYENDSRLDIVRSTLQYLGSDVSSSYGVSWRQGATGRVTHSIFQHNFFGVYTYDAHGIVFERSTFRNNVYYGMDPHTYSSNLTIEKNKVYGNGDHGIVFSRFVTDSVVQDNMVYGNKVNGIMMDYRSDRNVIRRNIVYKNGQGIVFSGSANNRAYKNVLTNNEVGVRASHDGADSDIVRANTIRGGHEGVHLYGGATQITVKDNRITGASNVGIEVDAPRSTLVENSIVGSHYGVELDTAVALRGGRIARSQTGIKIGRQAYATVDSTVVALSQNALRVDPGGWLRLRNTSFTEPASSSGLSTLSLFGIGILVFAGACEIIHLIRAWQLRRLTKVWLELSVADLGALPTSTWPVPSTSRVAIRRARLRDEPATARSPVTARPAVPAALRKFRPDIEGLRAIAVASVVLAHADLGVSGGYVGVDVFFVISGYLISRQLFEEHRRSGRISFASFYARRARRILPAATLVTVATLLMAWRWASPLRLASIAKDGLAAALFSVNWRLAAGGTDYFKASSPPSPFQHYWSLSVEEQFYIGWPLILGAVALLARRRFTTTRLLSLVLTACIAVSLFYCVVLTTTNEPYGYFGTQSRVWELALGALAAINAEKLANLPITIRRVMTWAGLSAVLTACFLFTTSTTYPGVAALLPVLGAVALIAGGCGAVMSVAPESVLLARRPMQALGKVSYSLYLWHWPLLILVPDLLGHSLTVLQRLIVIAVALALSALTFVFVENPIRHSYVLIKREWRAGVFGAGLIASSAVVALVLSGQGLSSGASGPATTSLQLAALTQLEQGAGATTPAAIRRQLTAAETLRAMPTGVTPSLADAPNSFPDTKGCEVGLTATALKLPCNVFGDVHSKTDVVLTGDSHAGMWLGAMEIVASQRHWRLTVLNKSGCSVGEYPHLVNASLGGVYKQCNVWRPKMIAYVRRLRPAMVVIGSEAHAIATSNGLARSIDRLKQSGAKVAFLADTPSLAEVGDAPDCLAKHLDDVSACVIPHNQAGLNSSGRVAEIMGAQQAGAAVIDPTPWMCNSAGCPEVIGKTIVYMDDSHITSEFGELRAPELGKALVSAMDG